MDVHPTIQKALNTLPPQNEASQINREYQEQNTRNEQQLEIAMKTWGVM